MRPHEAPQFVAMFDQETAATKEMLDAMLDGTPLDRGTAEVVLKFLFVNLHQFFGEAVARDDEEMMNVAHAVLVLLTTTSRAIGSAYDIEGLEEMALAVLDELIEAGEEE